ncbi:type II toxin-antitoxin system prevent-host-death family antitoxin [Mesorhizobium sp. WSM2239]|uniref:Type II toxin-antitoxin system prevent-host-death family antitoxin n=2 Tax=unclassified Mesorhizobium TaxID=325217 RepID=A0AAU8D4E5_9HYPH
MPVTISKICSKPLREGPQLVTRDGVEVAVLVAADEWNRITSKLTEPPSASKK